MWALKEWHRVRDTVASIPRLGPGFVWDDDHNHRPGAAMARRGPQRPGSTGRWGTVSPSASLEQPTATSAHRSRPPTAGEGSLCAHQNVIGQWIVEYRRTMLSVARPFANSVTTAEDIVQEASTVAVAQAHVIASSAESPKSWLAVVTKNVGRRVVAKRKRRKTLLEEWQAELPSGIVLDERMDDVWLDAVWEAARDLPPALQDVIRCMLEGKVDHEIRDRLDISKSALWVRRHRAITALREMLAAAGWRQISGQPCEGSDIEL